MGGVQLGRNRVRECLAAGRPAIGISMRSGNPTVAEMLAALDFDFVYFDMEHTPYTSFESVVGLIAAIEARGGSPWVRIPYADPHVIAKVAELGVHGIVIPHMNTPEEAQAAVNALRWPPHGTMGVGGRVRQFDYKVPFEDMEPEEVLARVDQIQRSIMLIGLIEDAAALERLDEILATDIDGLFPGSTDIAFTLGKPEARLRPHHPDVQAAIELVVDKCREHGKTAMFGNLSALQTGGLSPAEAVTKWAAKGIGIFQASVDLEILLRWSQSFLRQVEDVRVDGLIKAPPSRAGAEGA